jgi:(1->4)-alpha-D-glucan 1-alpha-D-glucosylmutase
MLFSRGEYTPLEVTGSQADRVVAFARTWEQTQAIVVVPRICSELLGTAQTPFINATHWGDTRIIVPFADSGSEWTGLFNRVVAIRDGELPVSAALEDFSVNLLIKTK